MKIFKQTKESKVLRKDLLYLTMPQKVMEKANDFETFVYSQTPFIHSSNKFLFGTYAVPGTVSGTWKFNSEQCRHTLLCSEGNDFTQDDRSRTKS